MIINENIQENNLLSGILERGEESFHNCNYDAAFENFAFLQGVLEDNENNKKAIDYLIEKMAFCSYRKCKFQKAYKLYNILSKRMNTSSDIKYIAALIQDCEKRVEV